MAVDRFSLCPGGTGRKIKFCNSECFPQLERLEKLVAAQQTRAAWQQVTAWLERTPNRACLWAYKCLLDRAQGNLEDHAKSAAEFARAFPDSPVALAELAIAQTLENRFSEATETLSASLEKCQAQGQFYFRILAAMTTIGEWLEENGHLPAALAYLWTAATRYDPGDGTDLKELTVNLCRKHQVPLDLRTLPWTGLSHQKLSDLRARVGEHMRMFRFTAAEEEVRRYLETHPDEPEAWYCLGNLRLWQSNYPGAAEAYLKCGQLDSTTPLGMLGLLRATMLKKTGTGDVETFYVFKYVVNDPEQTKEALLSDQYLLPFNVTPEQSKQVQFDSDVPPELQFFLYRFPWREGHQGLLAELENIRALVPGIVFFYGRQTDQPARLVVTDVLESDRPWVESRVKEWLGQQDNEPQVETMGNYARTVRMLLDLWMIARKYDQEERAEVETRLVESIPRWRLPLLEPLILEEAAQLPEKKQWVRMILADLLQQGLSPLVDRCVQQVWSRLGLDFPAEQLQQMLAESGNPLLGFLIDVKNLSDQEVTDLASLAVMYDETRLIARIGPEIFARRERLSPDVVVKRYLRYLYTQIFESVEHWFNLQSNIQEMVAYCDSHKIPHGGFHQVSVMGLLRHIKDVERSPELETSLVKALRTEAKHLLAEHWNDPAIADFVQAFANLLANAAQQGRPAGATAEYPGAEPSQRLWTPEEELRAAPTTEEDAPRKIWIPGMD